MHAMVSGLYNRYNKELRPLISEIEGRNEQFEEPLLLDVASMYDSMALSKTCTDDADRLCFLNQACIFLDLSISHSYQYLIKNLDEKMKGFEKRCNTSDRALLDGGKFIGKYVSLKQQAQESVRNGRKKDDVDAIVDYKSAYKAYSNIEKLIDVELPVLVMRNTRKASRWLAVAGGLASILISVIVGKLANIYGYTIIEWFKGWMSV